MHGLETETECSVVHGNEQLGVHFHKRLECLFGIHVDIAFAHVVVGPDGQKRDLDFFPLSDFFESVEIGTVACMENGAALVFHDEAAEASVGIMQHACTPVKRGSQCDVQAAVGKGLPAPQFLHVVESEVVHQIADVFGDDDGLFVCDGAEGPAVEMVEVGVGDKHEVDVGEVVKFDSGMSQAFDDFQPFRPVRVDQNAVLAGLEKEGRVSDPSDANLVSFELRKLDGTRGAVSWRKQGGQEHLGEKAALVPAFAEFHFRVVFGFWPGLERSCLRCFFYQLCDHNSVK